VIGKKEIRKIGQKREEKSIFKSTVKDFQLMHDIG